MVPQCNCKGVYLYNELILPKTKLKDETADFKPTLRLKDNTCKFCGYDVIWLKPPRKYKPRVKRSTK